MIWEKIASFILRQRYPILAVIAIITAVMGWNARNVQIRYDFAQMLPVTDSTYIDYEEFLSRFGEDGNVLMIGLQDRNLFELEKFNAWYDLGEELRALEGVDEVVSVARMYNLTRDDSLKKFKFVRLLNAKPANQAELDSIKGVIYGLPFYEGVLFNEKSDVTLMGLTISDEVLDSKKRNDLVVDIQKIGKRYSKEFGLDLHYSGLPFIRSKISMLVSGELVRFIGFAALATALILFVFFRSFKVVLFSMLVVGAAVTWCFGIVGLLGYKLSVLTGLIPPLIIIIGIPNCIFFLNKYQSEIKHHGGQARALTKSIRKVGNAILLTNVTTASGFAAFILIQSQVIREFGIVASLSILSVFLLSILLVPIIFSMLAPPSEKHMKHLDRKLVQFLVDKLVLVVTTYRRWVYVFTALLLVFGGIGISKMVSTGNMMDDLPKNDPMYLDLKFFEKHFNGVMPFEIEIDTKKPGKVFSSSTINRIDDLQGLLAEYPEFSRPISVVEALKYSRQAFYYGNPDKYDLPSSRERTFILDYVPGDDKDGNMLRSFLDSNKQITRVSAHIEDIGTNELRDLKADITPKIDSIFPPEDYDVTLTGTSVVFLKSNDYLIKNLVLSLALAIVIISLIMAAMFSSWRMVAVSLLPNIIPLVITAALMGYFGIPIKTSTILVFSIAFGISVDDTIHFLAKYRQELKSYSWNIRTAVILALKEVGVSMMYTSIVLFCGFSIFTMSTFGGTVALGLLTAITLFVAMFSNLIILPSLILSLEKILTTKAFKEPYLEIFDEEEDIELASLEVEKNDSTENSEDL